MEFKPKIDDLAGTPGRISGDSLDLDDYFVGPRDLDKHSKLPYFMRMHGSVLPRMVLPVLAVGAWATAITCISKFVFELKVATLLLTVLGFVVGLSLSFRSSTAYERYSEGRKTWCTLLIQCRNLARYVWIHVAEREGDQGTDDLLQKVTAINLILAYAVALKHRLRFEPYAHYPDIAGLVSHLDTYAQAAHKEEHLAHKHKSAWKSVGEHLGLSFAMSNPRKDMKRSDKPLGNLPMEIMAYLSAYVETIQNNGQMKSTVLGGQVMNALAGMTDTAGNAERVLTTPLPIGYNILISQVVLLYVYMLPFQLFDSLGWVTIPGTIAAAYIILGIATIGDELENPFGNDVNDLPLDAYCAELSRELDTLMSTTAPKFDEHLVKSAGLNQPLWPLSNKGLEEWRGKTKDEIRGALRAKVVVGKGGMGDMPL
ncbi:Bestrophin, RFP-TM, chloride channel-domain-containing protein [Rhexocercosporidium sp. MPI-PUGE-AT-0058]|nr:Bestrophin, RFP-TM, chloride channel-domain-containing protein [Rhexocercosporidium sp. MPI-PUGE-AT-0058]